MKVYHFESDGYQLNPKRCYFPAKIRGNCSHCQEPIVQDYFEVPVEYPKMDSVIKDSIHCEACHKYTPIKIKLRIQLELIDPAPEELTEEDLKEIEGDKKE